MFEQYEQELLDHGIDYADALDRFGGDGEMYESLALRFLDDKKFEQLKQAIDDDDAETGYRIGHALKGVTGNLSFAVYYHGTCAMCEVLKEGDLSAARDMLPDIETAHIQVITILTRVKPA